MKILITSMLLIASLGSALAETVRFKDLSSNELNGLLDGQSNLVVEFRKGDLIPLGLKVKGNLLSISNGKASFLKVEQDFFIKSSNSKIAISFDGQDYFPLNKALTGSLTVGATGNSIPTMLNILLHVEER